MGNTLKEAIAKEEGEAQLNAGDNPDNGNLQDGSEKAATKKNQQDDKDRYCRLRHTQVSEDPRELRTVALWNSVRFEEVRSRSRSRRRPFPPIDST